MKTLDHDFIHVGGMSGVEKFEVIREDLKDSFYSPKPDHKDNSDFKKFTAEDDYHHQSVNDPRWISRMN
jgi:hypothetical protein